MKRSIIFPLLLALLLVPSAGLAAKHKAIKTSKPFLSPNVYTSRILDLSIQGKSLATPQQCIDHLLRRNPYPAITVSAEELVHYYYEEAKLEGIRADVAFAQALHETGYFRYGGDVVALQNNYCGLGASGQKSKGAWFPNARTGVRAHIQHLLAYSSTRRPVMPIVDPRYMLVKSSDKFGQCTTWNSLDGRWAIPGKGYGQKIQMIHIEIITGK